MLVRSPTDLGAAIRDGRKRRGWTQDDLAKRAGVTARWLRDVEHGKSTAEIGLVFRVLSHLGIELDLADLSNGPRLKPRAPSNDEDFPDIDDIVREPKS